MSEPTNKPGTVFVVIQSIPYEGYLEPICVCATRAVADHMITLINRATYDSGYEVLEVPLADDRLELLGIRP